MNFSFVKKNITIFTISMVILMPLGYASKPKGEIIPWITALNNLKSKNKEENFANKVFLIKAKKLIGIIRKQGIFVDGYKITVDTLYKVPLPLVVFLKDEGWQIVTRIDRNTENISIMDSQGVEKEIPQAIFQKQWNGYVISKIIMNTSVYKMPYKYSSLSKNGKTVIIYLNHDKFKDPNSLLPLIDTLIKEAESWGGRVIYVDELGLIPEETVNNWSKSRGITRKQAFKKLKKLFQGELNKIHSGVPIYDPTYFYSMLYKHLAKYHMECYIENLEYKLWEFIVNFDSLNIFKKALDFFVLGDFGDAINSIDNYQQGYSTYNINIRDSNFATQLLELRQKYPNAIIFTVRGLAHYGFETKLVEKGEKVQVLLLGNNKFEENFVFQQLVYILNLNNVYVEKSEKVRYLLRTFPQELLRAYFYHYYNNMGYATKRSLDICFQLNVQDLYSFSKDLRDFYSSNSKPLSLVEVGMFTYNWMKGQGFIKEEGLKAIQK